MGLCLKTNPCLCGVGLLPGEKLIASRRAVLEHNFFFLLCILHVNIILMLNYRLSQKFKLLGNDEFNYLAISLTLFLTCGPKLPLNK